MRQTLTILLILAAASVSAQQTLSGTVTDKKGEAVSYANIYFEGSYDGTISDTEGNFSLSTNLTGEQLLTVSFMGYEKYSQLLHLDGKDTILTVVMKEQLSEIDEVTIRAGVFSASDK